MKRPVLSRPTRFISAQRIPPNVDDAGIGSSGFLCVAGGDGSDLLGMSMKFRWIAVAGAWGVGRNLADGPYFVRIGSRSQSHSGISLQKNTSTA